MYNNLKFPPNAMILNKALLQIATFDLVDTT